MFAIEIDSNLTRLEMENFWKVFFSQPPLNNNNNQGQKIGNPKEASWKNKKSFLIKLLTKFYLF